MTKQNVKRIIIADDHAVVRTGLQLIIDETDDMEIVDEAKNGDELLEKLQKERFDLVILDMSMPGKEALDILKEIKFSWSSLPVAIFTMNPDSAYALRMLQNGASAYINKQTHPDELIEVFRKVLNGEKYIFPHQMELFTRHITNPESNEASPHTVLTDREVQIFVMLASGIRKSEIAEKLGISKNTISNHRNSIMKKMNMSLNSDLTRYAIQHKIIH